MKKGNPSKWYEAFITVECKECGQRFQNAHAVLMDKPECPCCKWNNDNQNELDRITND
jgi:formylmethanofuran dehydrogenase subunit E